VVLYPTESYYGAAVKALDPGAVGRLVRLKGRPPDSPLPLILPDRASLYQVVSRVPARAEALMDRYWPGPLTLVLPARPGLPGALVGPYGVGVRLSPHPVAVALARSAGGPITATSANPAGAPPPRTASEAQAALPEATAVLDGGPLPGGSPSTVLAVAADGDARVLRLGAVHVQV
jgi:L-threonylcarbamoyladenylate synthase